jgi:hypothetical protein
LLLVAVADIEAREQHNDAAMLHARDALDDLERFGPPATVAPRDWPELKRKLAATANFALGRAALAKALELPAGEERTLLVRESELSLSRASSWFRLVPAPRRRMTCSSIIFPCASASVTEQPGQARLH